MYSNAIPAPRTVPTVPAVSRALAVLELLAQEREPMSVTRLASRLALPKSSTHGLCHTLAAGGYLRREDDGSFYIGPGVMALAHAFVGRTDAAREFAALWQELAQAPEETVILSVLDGRDVVYVGVRNSDRPLGLAFSVGMRLPAHLAASGRAMLAWRDLRHVQQLFGEADLPDYRGGGSQPVSALLDELRRTHERGYSIDDEGIREGVYCLGAPVFDATGQPVAGIGVAVHKTVAHVHGERHRDAVIAIARALTRRIGGTPPIAPTPSTDRGTR